MSERKRVRVQTAAFNVPRRPMASLDPPYELSIAYDTVSLKPYRATFTVSEETLSAAVFPILFKTDIHMCLSRALEQAIGFTPTYDAIRFGQEEHAAPIRPRWWDLLRWLHLRKWQEYRYVRFNASIVAAATPEYEIELW